MIFCLLSPPSWHFSCSSSSTKGSLLRNPPPHTSDGTRSPAKSSRVKCAPRARTWPRTASPTRPQSACRARRSNTPSCGTTCPGVSTATTSATTTRRWSWSARPRTTASVAASRASTQPMTSAADTRSAHPDWVLPPTVRCVAWRPSVRVSKTSFALNGLKKWILILILLLFSTRMS